MVDFGQIGKILGITGAYASTPVVDLAWSPNQ